MLEEQFCKQLPHICPSFERHHITGLTYSFNDDIVNACRVRLSQAGPEERQRIIRSITAESTTAVASDAERRSSTSSSDSSSEYSGSGESFIQHTLFNEQGSAQAAISLDNAQGQSQHSIDHPALANLHIHPPLDYAVRPDSTTLETAEPHSHINEALHIPILPLFRNPAISQEGNAVELHYITHLPNKHIFLAVKFTRYVIGNWFFGYDKVRLGNFRVDGLYRVLGGYALFIISSMNQEGRPDITTHPRFLAVPTIFLSPAYQQHVSTPDVDFTWRLIPEQYYAEIDAQMEEGRGTWWNATCDEVRVVQYRS